MGIDEQHVERSEEYVPDYESLETIEEVEEIYYPALEEGLMQLKQLKNLMHTIRNVCEHVKEKSVTCCLPYCQGVHNIREIGRNIFNKEFLLNDYEFYFFEPLGEAKRICYSDCSLSRFYFRMAENYVNNLIKSLC